MRQDDLIERVGIAAAESGLFEALFLAGSFGRGTPDDWSDIDLLGLVPAEHHAAASAWWRDWLAAQEPLVYFKPLERGGTLINAITESWLRVDLHLLAAAGLSGRSQDGLKPLFDPQGLYGGLVASLPPREPDRQRVESLIVEFIRVLGLMPVVLGRQEWVVMAMGTGLLRDMVSQLLQEQVPLADRGGMLHLNRLLGPADRAVLAELPYPPLEREALIEAHLHLARVFLPRARALATELGIDWPAAFEAATRAHLAKALERPAAALWS